MDSYNEQKKFLILISKKNISKNRAQRFYGFSRQTTLIFHAITKAHLVRFENSLGLSVGKIEKLSNPAKLQLNIYSAYR